MIKSSFSNRGIAAASTLAIILPACATISDVTSSGVDAVDGVTAASTSAVEATAASSAASAVDGDHHQKSGQFGMPVGDVSDIVAGTYKIEPTHAYLSFSYDHLGFSYPVLSFNTFDGSVVVDPENPANTTVSVTIDASSIDSRVEKFNAHLRGENFFDVEQFPEITFVSTAALPTSSGSGKITGDLNMKGITKPVVLDVVLHKVGENPFTKAPAFGISAKANINRSEWDLGAYTPNVSDKVKIVISAEFLKQ